MRYESLKCDQYKQPTLEEVEAFLRFEAEIKARNERYLCRKCQLKKILFFWRQ